MLAALSVVCSFPGSSFAEVARSAVDRSGQNLQAQVHVVESKQAIDQWIAGPKRKKPGGASGMRMVPKGRKIFLPIVVTGFKRDAASLNLVADWELLAPDGKTIATAEKCCTAAGTNPATPGRVVLSPVLDLIFDLNDPEGIYTVHVKVSDGTNIVTASERFGVENAVEPKKTMPLGQASTISSLEQNAATWKEPDPRHCLDLDSNRQVMACAEKYR